VSLCKNIYQTSGHVDHARGVRISDVHLTIHGTLSKSAEIFE